MIIYRKKIEHKCYIFFLHHGYEKLKHTKIGRLQTQLTINFEILHPERIEVFIHKAT